MLLLSLLSCAPMMGMARMTLPSDQRTSGTAVESAFEAQRQVLQHSSAVIYNGRKSIVFGAVVSKDGYILTKASELEGVKAIQVRVNDQHFKEVKLVGRDANFDLALLKVDAQNLTPITWAGSSDLPQGSWVVCNGGSSRTRRRVSIGIISANSREVKGLAPVVMGVGLEEDKRGLKVAQVSKNTGAERAGLKVGDVIFKFGGSSVTTREALIKRIMSNIPGDKVPVEFYRGDKSYKAEMELMARDDAFGKQQSGNDQMSGRYSKRRTNFSRVLQTDIPLNDRTVGGPLLDLSGRCIGLNIARANRAESFAIPVEDLKRALEAMMAKAK